MQRPFWRLMRRAAACAGLAALAGCSGGDGSGGVERSEIKEVAESHGPTDVADEARDGERLVIRPIEAPDLKPVSALLTTRDAGAARARIGGTLTVLSVREGDAVRKGQVIAVVTDDRRGLEASAGASQALAAEARAVQARADLGRAEDLYRQGVYAKARLDDARAAARAAEAQLNAALAGSEALSEVADQGRVLAPADGRVTKAPAPEGAVVMAGEVIAEIATGQRVLRVEVPEADGVLLREGDEIALAAAGGRPASSSKILQVYPAVENGKIIVDIDAAGQDVGFVGMRTPALIPVGVRRMILAPERFVQTRYGVDYVRLVRPEGVTIDAPIQRGGTIATPSGPMIEVLSGLVDGDVIVAPAEGPGAAALSREAL